MRDEIDGADEIAPNRGRRKNRRAWCKGKVGREHEPKWQPDPRGRGLLVARSWRVYLCQLCGKHVGYCIPFLRKRGCTRCGSANHPYPDEMAAMELDEHFNSGKVVCPFARTVDKVYFADNQVDAAAVGRWVATLLARNVAVVYAAGRDRDYEGARAWCEKMLVGLQGLIPHSERTPVGEGRLTPFMTAGSDTFYTIGMGPQYPSGHTRYAPRLCLVSVNERQIREVAIEKREKIRAAMQQRIGVPYDADEVWLAVNPQRRS